MRNLTIVIAAALLLGILSGPVEASRPSPLGTPVPLTPTKVLLAVSPIETPTPMAGVVSADRTRRTRERATLPAGAPRLYFWSWSVP